MWVKHLSFLVVIPTMLFAAGCRGGAADRSSSPGYPPVHEYNLADSSVSEPMATEEDLAENAGLPEYLQYAALHNPGLEAAFNGWHAAAERVPQAKSLMDPRLTYRYYVREVETRVGPQKQGVEIAQMFPWFGKLDLAADVAAQEAAATYQRYETEKQKLFFAVREAYYEFYYLGRSIDITGENLTLLQQLEEVVRQRYETGNAPHAAVVKFQVEIGKMEDRLRSLRDMEHPIKARLNAALNRPAEAALFWPDKIDQDFPVADDQALISRLRENNPELAALNYTIEKEKSSVDLAKKQYAPDFTLGAGWIETGDSVKPQPDSGTDPVMVTLSINIPLWRDRLDSGVEEARQRMYAAVHKHENRENTLLADLQMALYRYRDAERKIDLYQNALIPKAEQSLAVTQQEFMAGRTQFLDMIDAIRTLLEFHLSHERALADLGQSYARIDLLVGSDPFAGRENTPSDFSDDDAMNK